MTKIQQYFYVIAYLEQFTGIGQEQYDILNDYCNWVEAMWE